MHGLSTAVAASGWSLGGSIMTFAIPVGLFVVVATALWFIYSRPPVAPGHSDVIPGSLTPRHAAAGTGQPGEEQGAPGGQAAAAPSTETPGTGTQSAEDAE